MRASYLRPLVVSDTKHVDTPCTPRVTCSKGGPCHILGSSRVLHLEWVQGQNVASDVVHGRNQRKQTLSRSRRRSQLRTTVRRSASEDVRAGLSDHRKPPGLAGYRSGCFPASEDRRV